MIQRLHQESKKKEDSFAPAEMNLPISAPHCPKGRIHNSRCCAAILKIYKIGMCLIPLHKSFRCEQCRLRRHSECGPYCDGVSIYEQRAIPDGIFKGVYELTVLKKITICEDTKLETDGE
jgi:hypothetical protein